MKKTLLFLFAIFFANLLVAQELSFTYNFDDYKISSKNEFQLISFENTMQFAKVGEPMLPYQSVKLLLPPGKTVDSYDIVYENEINIEGKFKLFPKQYVRPVSSNENNSFVINNEVYNSQNYSTKENVTSTVEFMNGYGFFLTSITPVVYNPLKQKISYYKKVTINVKYKEDKKSNNALNNLKSSENILEQVTNFAQNPEILNLYPKQKTINNYQVLIVTGDSFKDKFDDLQYHYLTRGLKSQIITVEEIEASYSGVDAPEKIRDYINNEYQNNGIEYVLLAGDVDVVPYRGFYCSVQSSSVYSDDNIPSDLYYSCLDGSWNDNNNELWGEIGEDDLLPEVAVARLSFSNDTDFDNMLNKFFSYQNNPVEGELNNPLLAGEFLYDDPISWGADYLDLLIGYQDENGYQTTGIPEAHPYVTMYDRDDEWTPSELISEINEGHSFIHHSGHSNTTYTMRLYSSDITSSNFSQVNGTDHNYSLLYTHGCICGDYAAEDCIGEEMVKIDNFLVAFVGNSRYGWFNEGQTEGPSEHLHREFVDALYAQKENRIGKTQLLSKANTAPWVTAPGQHEEGAIRWCFYDNNVLADPTLQIWTDEPIDINTTFDENVSLGENYSLTITTDGQPAENLTCVIIQNNNLLGVGLTDASGNANFNIDYQNAELGDAELIITGYNCLKTVYPVNILPSNNAIISLDSYEITDNNNNLPDYNENILFNVTLQNLGLAEATNINLTLSSNDQYLTNSYCYANIASILGESTETSTGELCILINNNVPNNHKAIISLNIVCDQGSWTNDFEITINAPEMEFGNLEMTEVAGNNNGILDANETMEFDFEILNSGQAISPNTTVTLSCDNNNISFEQASLNLEELNISEIKQAVFSISSNSEILEGDQIVFTCDIISGEYSAQKNFTITVGQRKEDFESSDFSQYNWLFDGQADWLISNTVYNSGLYAAESGNITDDETSILKIFVNIGIEGELSFYKKVSSEEDYDFLTFKIDGLEQENWSGEIDWTQNTYNLATGSHTLEWIYSKDFSVSTGQDKAWVDDIIFPPFASDATVIQTNITNDIVAYPNPFTNEVNFANNEEFIKIEIFNNKGQLIEIIENSEKPTWNSSKIQKGVYFYKIIKNTGNITGKLIKI